MILRNHCFVIDDLIAASVWRLIVKYCDQFFMNNLFHLHLDGNRALNLTSVSHLLEKAHVFYLCNLF